MHRKICSHANEVDRDFIACIAPINTRFFNSTLPPSHFHMLENHSHPTRSPALGSGNLGGEFSRVRDGVEGRSI